ncbi:MAG: hypothetical protein LBG98_03070 [Puniceicoccales bacterium]|jgi:hypothetical protein|nr:hypothetical protein [Puniceicoccales bacterium]
MKAPALHFSLSAKAANGTPQSQQNPQTKQTPSSRENPKIHTPTKKNFKPPGLFDKYCKTQGHTAQNNLNMRYRP